MILSANHILLIHNRYLELGGEEFVVEEERSLLEEHGHDVRILEVGNEELRAQPPLMQITQIISTTKMRERLAKALVDWYPDIIHVHNWMPQVTTVPYKFGAQRCIPVVQTLHNYRLLCLNGLLLRDGKICELCTSCFPVAGVRYGCYRDSKIQSIGAALLQMRMRWAITHGMCDAFIAVSEAQRCKLVEASWFPGGRIWVKPNFVRAHIKKPSPWRRHRVGLLYVGRLSQEKGLHVILQAMNRMREPPPLTVLGDGPDAGRLRKQAHSLPVSFIGRVDRNKVWEFMQAARLLVFPSTWYEGMPLSVLEAMAAGLPVIASTQTGASEAVGESGWCVPAGDIDAWTNVLLGAYRDTQGQQEQALKGVSRYKKYYSPEASYRLLRDIYDTAISGCQKHKSI